MEANPEPPGSGKGPSSSAAADQPAPVAPGAQPPPPPPPPSRYESQKRRDWNTFQRYLRNHKPPLSLSRCSGAHVIEFLRYLDQFGKTRVHQAGCAFFGHPNPAATCACPLQQAWGSLDALIGRLRAAYEDSGGRAESSPFATRAVRSYLREVRESQAKARGIPYEKKKKRKRSATASSSAAAAEAAAGVGGGEVGTAVAAAPSGATSAAGGGGPMMGFSGAAMEGSGAPPGDGSSF